MNVFEAVKQTVTTRQAAECYGIYVNRAGKANCPFHNDRTPSMKVDKRFHCFGCGADGDVIDFTAQLYGLDAKSAAEKLAADFPNPLYTLQKKGNSEKDDQREIGGANVPGTGSQMLPGIIRLFSSAPALGTGIRPEPGG